MSDTHTTVPTPSDAAALLEIAKEHGARIEALERQEQKTLFKSVTTSASASALILGIVLSVISLYGALVTKPRADHAIALTKFNEAVNAAANAQAQIIRFRVQTKSESDVLAMEQAATPQILDDISTAKVYLADLNGNDVGIPQLIVLSTVSLFSGDTESAKQFLTLAVDKKSATPYLHAEAERFDGQFFFQMGDPKTGRKLFQSGLNAVARLSEYAPERALILGELAQEEFSYGSCVRGLADFKRFSAALRASGMSNEGRLQISAMVRSNFNEMPNSRCQAPANIGSLTGR